MAKDRVPVIAVGLLGLVVLGGAVLFRFFAASSTEARTNARLAHDPAVSRRAKADPGESIAGDLYVNRGLGVSLRKPPAWEMSLGRRVEDPDRACEGLLVKVEEKPGGKDVPPTLSLTRRTLKPGQPADPAAYVRDVILGDGKKTAVRGPEPAAHQGLPGASVSFQAGDYDVYQRVVLRDREVFTLTAMAPRGRLDSMKSEIDAVFSSLSLKQVER